LSALTIEHRMNSLPTTHFTNMNTKDKYNPSVKQGYLLLRSLIILTYLIHGTE